MPEQKVEIEKVGVYEFKVRVGLAAVLIIFCLFAIAAYVYLPNWRETLTFASLIIGVSATIFLAYSAILTLRSSVKREMLKSALSLINLVQSHELTKVRTLIEEKLGNGNLPPLEIYKVVTGDKDTHDAVRTVLNHLENVSISVQKGESDEEMVYLGLCWIVPNVYKNLTPYIDERRKYVDKIIWVEVERLAKNWESKKYLSTGKPLPNLV